MKISTWNVNSIRTRLPRLVPWLVQTQPDIVCCQELKCTEEQFPFDDLAAVGYRAAVFGQKAWNGVAILYRGEYANVQTQNGFDQWTDEFNSKLCSRLITAGFPLTDGRTLCVVNGYFPVGEAPGSEKFDYKMRWYDALRAHLARHFSSAAPVVILGDMNIMYDPKVDARYPDVYEGGPLANPPLREKFDLLLSWGVKDLFRWKYPDKADFSWYDYRRMAMVRHDGVRLDYILGTDPIVQSCKDVYMEFDLREGDKPSDHLPVTAELDLTLV